MIRKLLLIFVSGFLLNWIWENLHSRLYFHPDGRIMGQTMLLEAALFDAIFITVMAVLFIRVAYFRERKWYALIFGFVAAIVLEIYATNTGRWAYNGLMPIIPLLNVGLTPAVQLGILSYLIFKWKV